MKALREWIVAIATVTLTFSIVVSYFQLTDLREYRRAEFKRVTYTLLTDSKVIRILQDARSLKSDEIENFNLLDDNKQAEIMNLIKGLDYISALVVNGIVDNDFALVIVGNDIMKSWRVLAQLVKDQHPKAEALYSDGYYLELLATKWGETNHTSSTTASSHYTDPLFARR